MYRWQRWSSAHQHLWTFVTYSSEMLKRFHELRHIFITEGVRQSISLPRQHALCHYLTSSALLGSPNCLCSSITHSKHIKAVKEPWHNYSLGETGRITTLIFTRRVTPWQHRSFRLNQGEESELDGEEMSTRDEDGGLDVNEHITQEKNRVEERLGNAGPENGPVSFID